LGVPVGGAADRFSLAIGNALVGNPPDAAGLEITLAGPTLQAECDLACVVSGAPFVLTVDRERVASGKTFTLRRGATLHIGGTATRLRAYLCVRGGIDVAPILDSRSGLAPVKDSDLLPCQPGTIGVRWIELNEVAGDEPVVLRFVDGPQTDWFEADGLLNHDFTVTHASNRMGLRLRGLAQALPARELVSEPVCPGSVQVTRDGQCIILGVDGQTIGGYPKIAQVISADLDQVGQLRPDESIRFERVTISEAQTAYRGRRAQLAEWLTRLRETDRPT
jgi:antagonist of KipI